MKLRLLLATILPVLAIGSITLAVSNDKSDNKDKKQNSVVVEQPSEDVVEQPQPTEEQEQVASEETTPSQPPRESVVDPCVTDKDKAVKEHEDKVKKTDETAAKHRADVAAARPGYYTEEQLDAMIEMKFGPVYKQYDKEKQQILSRFAC